LPLVGEDWLADLALLKREQKEYEGVLAAIYKGQHRAAAEKLANDMRIPRHTIDSTSENFLAALRAVVAFQGGASDSGKVTKTHVLIKGPSVVFCYEVAHEKGGTWWLFAVHQKQDVGEGAPIVLYIMEMGDLAKQSLEKLLADETVKKVE
jgi:hypothetical protein